MLRAEEGWVPDYFADSGACDSDAKDKKNSHEKIRKNLIS